MNTYISDIPEKYEDDFSPSGWSFRKRAQSLHLDERHRAVKDFNHFPLEFDYQRDGHREITYGALPAQEGGRLRWQFQLHPRANSNDHQYERYLRGQMFSSDVSAPSGTTPEPQLESEDGPCTIEELTPNDTLCSKCLGINVESLSVASGFAHYTLDALKQSALTCALCKTLLDCQRHPLRKHATNRYQIVLTLRGLEDERTSEDHFLSKPSTDHLHDALSVATWDLRPKEAMDAEFISWFGDSALDKNAEVVAGKSILQERHITCYTTEHDPARKYRVPWLRKVGSSTGSAYSLSIAKQWLDQCLATTRVASSIHDVSEYTLPGGMVAREDFDTLTAGTNHSRSIADVKYKHEPQEFPKEVPARLLEVIAHDNGKDITVRLIETQGSEHKYATLSYCWGKLTPRSLTTVENLRSQLRHINLQSLPATIRDCCHIVPHLGLRYVWVDALCIIQDSESDWAAEAAKIGGIYRGSVVTIAATKSSSSEGGCFNKRSQSPISHNSYNVCLRSRLRNGESSRLCVMYPHFVGFTSLYEHEVEGSEWAKRAWVYQERVLSQRILYFARSQLFWECEHCRLSEDNGAQDRTQHIYSTFSYKKLLSSREVFWDWHQNVVGTYSARKLTFEKDRMVAISAIAKATYLNRRIDYIAGLWKDCIIPGLLWARSSPGRKSTAGICPSWSWASQESSINYNLGLASFGRSEADKFLPDQPKVIDIHVETEPANPFADVRHGYIKLDTITTVGWVMRKFLRPYNYSDKCQMLLVSEESLPRIWEMVVTMDDDDRAHEKVTIAVLSYDDRFWDMLVLEPVPGKEQVYRRIGCGTMHSALYSGNGFSDIAKNWLKEVITIE